MRPRRVPSALRPPCVQTCQPPAGVAPSRRSRRRCIASRSAPTRRRSSCGFAIALEFMLILSAPAFSSRRTSATDAHAAADRQRDEDLRRDRLDHLEDQVAVVGRRGDVEERQLVGPGVVVALRDLDRIAGVAQFDEVDALDDATGVDVEAGDDAFGEHEAFDCRGSSPRRRPGPDLLVERAITNCGPGLRRGDRSVRDCASRTTPAMLVRLRLRILEVEVARVDRAAADHAFDAFVLDRAAAPRCPRCRDRPPDAITGTVTLCASFSVASMLMPDSMPSRPMSV